MMLRRVTGDFVMRVRVGGDFREAEAPSYRRAGLVVTDGTKFVRLIRESELGAHEVWVYAGMHKETLVISKFMKVPRELRVSLRIERKRGVLTAWFSSDDATWIKTRSSLIHPTPLESIRLQETVKVGVYAESCVPGPWKVEFDKFSLSQPTR
jgi:regulation of enolase protein 1 (concanavalin A-like superfamily)